MTAQPTEQQWVPADTFASRLLLVRREKRMTVEQVSKACGVAQPTWTTWENGARPRDLVNVVQKISDALGVSRDWLMWGSQAVNGSPWTVDLPPFAQVA